MSNPNRTPIWGQYMNPDTGEIINIISNTGALKVETWFDTKNISAEVEGPIDNIELIPAPGEGKRIVIRYGSIRGEPINGKAYFEGIIDGAQHLMSMVYFSQFKIFTGIGVTVKLDENTNLRWTAEIGSYLIFYYIIYTIEDIVN